MLWTNLLSKLTFAKTNQPLVMLKMMVFFHLYKKMEEEMQVKFHSLQ